MKPQSASKEVFIDGDLKYRTCRDSKGTSRRLYITDCPICGKEKTEQKSRLSERRRCLDCRKKTSPSTEVRNKISATLRKKYREDGEFKARVAAAQNVKSGADHWNWKGGITPITQQARTSKEAKDWSLAVLYRDGFKCRLCSSTESLHAHHLNSWAESPDERFVLENGMTLCEPCHKFYHHYEREARNNANFNKFG